MGDEDFFSDDAFDDLPDDTLQQLEQNAISSTQRAKAAGPASRFPPNNRLGSNSNLSAAAPVKSKLPWRPPQPQSRPLPQPQYIPQAPPASAPAPPSSDYGLDDEEDIINLDEPSMVIQPASGPHTNAFSNNNASRVPSAAARSKPTLSSSTSAAFAAADAELDAHNNQWIHAPHLQPQPQNGNGNNSMDLTTLQSRIAELEAESARLQQSEAAARTAAAVKAGENAIVRSKAEAQAKEYERRIAVMQKLAADDAVRAKQELEVQRKESEKMATDNRFLQHDLEQESERVKRLNGGMGKMRAMGSGTPKKGGRTTGIGDGFEDLEVTAVSPSRSREKMMGTPKHGAKRRRTANDSPVAALSFTQLPAPPGGVSRQVSGDGSVTSSASEMKVKVLETDQRYAFMQRLLNHIPYPGHSRSIEALSKHHLPSTSTNPTPRSLSADLLDLLSYPAPAGTEQETGTDYLPLKLSRALLKLWTHCLNSHFHAPLYLLLDLLRFALYSELPDIKAQLIEEVVPLCIRTVDLIATPAARMSSNPTYAASLDREKLDETTEELCPDEVMEFLLQLCEAATLVEGRLEVFWREVGLEFALLMLHRCHPVAQINAMLRMLSTSALEGSFGPLAEDRGMQVSQENGILDRMTSLIFEIPEVPEGEEGYSEVEVAGMRIHLLGVLRALCQTDHGCLLLAENRSLIGRLIRFLDGQINRLYTLPPAFSQVSRTGNSARGASALSRTRSAGEGGGDCSAHGLVVKTINTTTRLFYHILRVHNETIDLTAKLNVIHGGHQKFLVCMSRVAFSEQSVLEQGIEDEVVEAAHSILDSYLSPEEGEAIVAAVETPRGSKGSHREEGVGMGVGLGDGSVVGGMDGEEGDVDMDGDHG
ncbi:hypothetical protein LTS10_012379 [Elasticomyces elasticus]|nr:hypothetical protein LTS10_012379 [Elasticomyces elasticus]